MKTQKLRKILFFMPILPFTLTLIFFATNASARHIETRAGWAANGIASSYHNLSSSGPYVSNGRFTGQDPATLTPSQLAIAARGTTEMCVYCHTPHFADRGKGPLWNRNFTGTVEAYGTTIAKNNDGNGNANMFSTIGCLSCHDGVTTFDNIINQPGKDTGNVQARTGSYRWGFTMPSYKDSGLSMPTWDHFASAACTGCHENEMMEGVAPRLDISRLIIGEQDSPGLEGKTNLSNDHPIGVVYRGAGDPNASASLRARTVAISGINMDIETENGAPMPALVSGNLWAIKGFISNSASIQDLLRSGTGQGSGNYVQCTSCHDAHFKNQTNPEKWFYSLVRRLGSSYDVREPVLTHDAFEVNGLFLRRVGGNSDSGLCRTCHVMG